MVVSGACQLEEGLSIEGELLHVTHEAADLDVVTLARRHAPHVQAPPLQRALAAQSFACNIHRHVYQCN